MCLRGRYLYEHARQTPLPLPDAQGDISIRELDYYVTRRVQELAGEEQAVVTNHTGNVALDRIPIARVRQAVGRSGRPFEEPQP